MDGSRADFDPEAHRLDIQIDFAPGSRFACPTCGAADCPPHDTERTTWRHLNFFQHQAYLNARVPRSAAAMRHKKVASVGTAGERLHLAVRGDAHDHDPGHAGQGRGPDGGRARHQAVAGVPHYVDQARARSDASGVTQLAIDETAARGGQDDITLFVDIEKARVLFATEGKDGKTVAAFADDLTAHGGDPAAIAEVCIDMSAAFIKGVTDNLPEASITFDKFHAVKVINGAVDQVRREEVKSRPELKQSRYVWLKTKPTCQQPAPDPRQPRQDQPQDRPRLPNPLGFSGPL